MPSEGPYVGGACVLPPEQRVVGEASCVAMVTKSLPGAGAEEVLGGNQTCKLCG